MDPLPPYKTSNSMSRSRSTPVSSASTVRSLAGPLDGNKASFTSASVSRSPASQTNIRASAEALLRSPVPRSVSSSTSLLTSSSVSRSETSQNGLGVMAEAMLRQPVPRSASLPNSSISSQASVLSFPPPSYCTTQSSIASATRDSEKATARQCRHPPSPKPTPIVKPLSSIRSNSGSSPSPSLISAAESKRRVRQVQNAVNKASARTPARNTKGMFKAVTSTDLLFLIDTTSSMEPYIAEAKNQVKNIMVSIQRAFLGESIVRVAVVGYKDHCDSPNIEFLDFTRSMDEAQEFLGHLNARGGEGWTADVLGGIQQATNASWMQNTRCIVHIADAPGHSRSLHDMPEAQDNKYYKPGSEPHGLTYNGPIKLLVRLGINYTFLQINQSTDRMLKVFSSVYKAVGADCQLLPTNTYCEQSSSKPNSGNSHQLLFQELPMGVDVGSLKRLVLQSVSDSITRTSSRHSIAFGSNKINGGATTSFNRRLSHQLFLFGVREDEKETSNVCLEAAPPQWNSPGWLDKKWDLEGYCPEVVVYSESTLADMMASNDSIKLSFAQLTVHARSTPFSKGAQRVASYARIAASSSQFVVKSFISGGRGLEHLIEEMQIQALCKAFALEFNGLVTPEQSLDFVVTACLQSKADAVPGGGSCWSLEPFLVGEYIKYNNNGLYVNEDSPNDTFNRVAQAFSHFTFERSWGHFMVVDLQGVGNLLTDPAIHTLDPDRFKLNEHNYSSDGFKCFFAMHACNSVCHQLGLVSNRNMARSGNWQFRQQWPAIEPTVCCSNKFCQRIVRRAKANESPKFPNYLWCDACWPQLQASMVRWICAAPGDNHEFDVCRFFYVSQGKLPPHKCPDHVEKDTTASSTVTVVGGLWSRMKTESKRDSVFGNEY
ncbi:hypothetical protein F4680DRAFT_13405 [Xylaria scruposa]|nr:hypothetical protein F4680DRAFT_13405 [Xylaria scruposa]